MADSILTYKDRVIDERNSVQIKIDRLDRAHFEALFQPWMNWDNYGEWQIDHKKPCSLFDHTNPNHIKECWALENLQPLSVADNMKKGWKYEPS